MLYSLVRKSITTLLACLSIHTLSAQIIQSNDSACNITLTGKVIDEHDQQPLEFATISLKDMAIGTTADSNGNYTLKNLCPGTYIIKCTHVGCDPVFDTIELSKNTTLNFYPEHHAIDLNGALITPKNPVPFDYKIPNLYKNRTDKSPQERLKANPTVSLAQTGARVTKPIIWGLYGNRIAIFENGVPINDQQWGQDHAPAINNSGDVSITPNSDITPLNTESGGGVIQVKGFDNAYNYYDTTFRGDVGRYFSSNGRNYGTRFNVHKAFHQNYGLVAELGGEINQGGDLKAPNYYLTNTGFNEYSINSLLRYRLNENSKWTYNITTKNIRRENGVLLASHIGNINDLTNAINSSKPLIIKDFSYDINNPRQVVSHDLYSVMADYSNNIRELNIIYAFQENNRQEYDIRRAGRDGTPSLDLNLKTHYASLNLAKNIEDKKTQKYQTGITYLLETNINNPNTGIRPLIPNFEGTKTSIYYLRKLALKTGKLDLGARLNYRYIYALKYNFSNELENYEYNFYLPSANVTYQPKLTNKNTDLAIYGSYSNRAPAVNELFSEGLHHSAASIEEGNINLKQENSYKLAIDFKYNFKIAKNSAQLSLNTYTQHINNYIQLKAEDELRQTIQGAFPVYNYAQTDAQFIGFISSVWYAMGKKVVFNTNYRYLLGKDLNSDYLAFIPGNRLSTAFSFNEPKIGPNPYSTNDTGFLKRLSAEIGSETVFKQNKYNAEGMFSPPPVTYTLINININYPIIFRKQRSLLIGLSVDNLLDTEYRDYMDRLRYFAALPGRNILLNIKYSF